MKTDSDFNLIDYTMDGFLKSVSEKENIDWPSEFSYEDKINFIDDLINYNVDNDRFDNCTVLQKMKDNV